MSVFWITLFIWLAVGCCIATWTYRAVYRVVPYEQHPALPEPVFRRYQLLFPGYAYEGIQGFQDVRDYSLFWLRGRLWEAVGWCIIASLGPLRLVWACCISTLLCSLRWYQTPVHYYVRL